METIILLLIAISLSMNVLYTSVTTYYSNKNTMNFPDKEYPSVTILKPVKGIDDEMEKNLESFFKLDYPDFEILFGVDSKKDEVTGLITKVMKRFPNVDAKIIETGHRGDQNPKVYKLSFMEKFSRGSLFWISDSNIRVENNTLKSLAEEYILNGTHLIFSPIRATGSRTFGSLIENSYMNHYLSGNVLGAWVLFRKEVVVGKSMLIEKKALRSFGGFSYFKDYLAEDQILGETFRNSGYLISTNNTWVTNFNSSSTTKSFYSRMSRWAKLRFNIHRSIYFGEILTNTTALGILSVGILEERALLILPPVFFLRVILELITSIRINRADTLKLSNFLLLPAAIIIKDLVLALVYFSPFFSNQVNWRGEKMKIGKRTLLSNSFDIFSIESV